MGWESEKHALKYELGTISGLQTLLAAGATVAAVVVRMVVVVVVVVMV